jgi:hypothetical protein
VIFLGFCDSTQFDEASWTESADKVSSV